MQTTKQSTGLNFFMALLNSCPLTLKILLLLCILSISVNTIAERDSTRDQYRNPMATLNFFGVRQDMDVVEISPGGGWYTEILADFVQGDLLAAHYDPNSERAYYRNSQSRFAEKIAADPDLYNNVKMHIFDASEGKLSVSDSSADAVVTFRNVHNWMSSGTEGSSFDLFFKALKPGGILGVVEHRATPGTDRPAMRSSGYMTQSYVKELALNAGFKFEESSEINANKKDTADHPKGVWTLPPSLALGLEDREKYLAIGESDRMTLRFRKPK